MHLPEMRLQVSDENLGGRRSRTQFLTQGNRYLGGITGLRGLNRVERQRNKIPREKEYFILQAVNNVVITDGRPKGGGYFLFPHRNARPIEYHEGRREVRIPSLCCINYFLTEAEGEKSRLRLGHPSTLSESWDIDNKTARKGDEVLLCQGGQPEWLRGIWAKGRLASNPSDEGSVLVKVEDTLDFSLIAPKRLQRFKWKDTARLWLDMPSKQSSHRGNSIRITKNEFERIHGLSQFGGRPKVPSTQYDTMSRVTTWPNKAHHEQSFEQWFDTHLRGASIEKEGWPDYLVRNPTGDVWAYEVKRDITDEPTDIQKSAHRWLTRIGIPVYTVIERAGGESDFAGRIARRKIRVVGQRGPMGKTNGWPDF